jgi:hypothetical protein
MVTMFGCHYRFQPRPSWKCQKTVHAAVGVVALGMVAEGLIANATSRRPVLRDGRSLGSPQTGRPATGPPFSSIRLLVGVAVVSGSVVMPAGS